MNRYRSFAFRFLSLLVLFSLALPGVAAPNAAQAARPAQQSGQGPDRSAHFQEVPAEIRSIFEGGISLDRFRELNGGRLPQAIQEILGQEMALVVELEAQPLAGYVAQQQQLSAPLSVDAQQAYSAALLGAQAAAVSGIQALGGRVLSQYTKAYNGLLVRVPANQVQALSGLPGVKSVHRAPEHVPLLSTSVPHIRADQVTRELGLDGTDTTIAIIDTGVDYTHAAFGGPGTPEAFAANDPTVIEPGSFPTAKVIGGYDFAGANYDASSNDPLVNTPAPDPDPLDGNGHGTHVAGIAAGMEVPGELGRGVAPGAKIYALKVFGDSGSTNVALNAIEWAMDPNQDNDLSDRVDVINMSLGSRFGIADILDPEIVAVEYASSIGIVVVAAAGNAGDIAYITDIPGAADSAISVAASTHGFITGPTVTLSATDVFSRTQFIYSPGNFDEETGVFSSTVSAPLAYVGNLFADDLLCTIPPEAAGTTPLAGQVALIQRGVCGFSDKANNAAALGAVAALIFNHAAGGNSLVSMVGPPVAIPTGFVARDDGLILAQAHGQVVTISAETEAMTIPDPFFPADTIANFSSRGPRSLDSIQKPDVTAPGVSIFSAKMGSGNQGTTISGTSMATPHVAGVAALMRQKNPGWTPEQIKAAMMNTAVDLASGSAEVPRQGAGRVDAYRAVTAEAFAIGDEDQVSLSWGVIDMQDKFYNTQKVITLHDLSGEPRVYAVDVVWGENSPTTGVFLRTPMTIEVTTDRRFANLLVDLTVNGSLIDVDFRQLEEYYGHVILTDQADPANTLRVPFYLIPQPHSRLVLTDVDFRRRMWNVEIQNQGPVTASLWVYPLYEADPNEVLQEDQADLRLVGLDYGFAHATYGDIFVPAINTYGPWFTPQPYFAEFDLYLDPDADGDFDLLNFNWNLGAATGGGDDDQWVVIQVDLSTLTLTLGSPFLIYTDYNAGYMEWALPATWNGLDPAAGQTDFNWRLFSFDPEGHRDSTDAHYFDLAHLPYTWELTHNPGPDNPTAHLTARLNDRVGLRLSNPLGLMLVDYNGLPGIGQAYAITQHGNPLP